MGDYEVIMDGGGPWGIRLQGGKDFGVPLNVARVTPGSKACLKGMLAGDHILSINNNNTEHLTHMEAQNLIKSAGDRLQLCLKNGPGGVSPAEMKHVGSGAFAAQPKLALNQTDVKHSAGVDHKYNAKPRTFISSTNASAGSETHVSVPVARFDPGEYARKKKEELQRYREEKPQDMVDSDVLKMLQKTSVQDKQNNAGLQKTDVEGQHQAPEGNVAFRMTADGTDLSDVSPGSRAVMEDIKNRGPSSLSSSGAVSGGSKSFRILQHLTSQDEDLPPPPPELMGNMDYMEDSPRQVQSNTFKLLQQCVESGTADQVRTGLDKPRNPSFGNVPHPVIRNVDPSREITTTVDPIPKAPFPSGPNFKVRKPAAPTFKSGSTGSIDNKGPPPPAVNAGEILNPNSRVYQTGAYPVGGPTQLPQDDFGRGRSSHGSSTSSQPQDDFGRGRSSHGSSTSSLPPPVTPQSPKSPKPSQDTSKEKLVCQSCQQPFQGGPFVSAIGKTWHPQHFCCSSCHVSLQNQAFVEENNKLFCEKCYNQYYAPKCAHCNNAIIGNCVNALGKSWHPDHFICSFCNKSFGNDGFLVDNGRPYCGKCFEDLFSVKCGKCAQPITGGEKYVEALNKNWHSDCFSCNYCNIRLEGNSFYVNRGMPYCQQHKSSVM